VALVVPEQGPARGGDRVENAVRLAAANMSIPEPAYTTAMSSPASRNSTVVIKPR